MNVAKQYILKIMTSLGIGWKWHNDTHYLPPRQNAHAGHLTEWEVHGRHCLNLCRCMTAGKDQVYSPSDFVV